MKPLVVFIVGPTGAGKTAFAVKAALAVGGEIISCDSMQVYKGMPVISRYPDPKQLRAVRHHLIGVLSPAKEYSAASFMKRARRLIKEIHGRGKIPFVVGGSGLYIKALVDGLFPSPPKNESFRRRLYREAGRHGNERLHKRLAKADPVYAAKVHPNDLKKIVRALEICRFTKSTVSASHGRTRGIWDFYNIRIFGLKVARPKLYRAIDRRVDEMFRHGAVEEVERLSRGKVSRTAAAALGYKEILASLRGEYDPAEAQSLMKRNTRRFAKRQVTWFRRDGRIVWVKANGDRRSLETIVLYVRKTCP